MNKIIIATDHAAFELKEYLKKKLKKDGFLIDDIGVYNTDRMDYPDIISQGAKAIQAEKYKKGLFLCGSGIGASITANRYKKVRAALVYDEATARLSRQHNNANVIVFGLLVSTLITLFVIPCFVAILDDIKGSRKKAPLGVTAAAQAAPYEM